MKIVNNMNTYNSSNSPVTSLNTYAGKSENIFCMIDNYIYLYHTDTLIAIPTYPDQITDSMSVKFNSADLLSRSAPIYSYANSGPRTFEVSLKLHRDMMNSVNTSMSILNAPNIGKSDYVDTLIKQLQAAALPKYAAAQKMVDPPIVAVKFGSDLFCKGVVTSGVNTTYSGPILRTDKYAVVDVTFQLAEIDPYDAVSVMQLGHRRGITKDLERRVYNSSYVSI